jgi:hypothetical protein
MATKTKKAAKRKTKKPMFRAETAGERAVGENLTTGQAADAIGLLPRQLATVIYESRVLRQMCPVVGRFRMIPRDSLETVAMEARRAGHAEARVKVEN